MLIKMTTKLVRINNNHCDICGKHIEWIVEIFIQGSYNKMVSYVSLPYRNMRTYSLCPLHNEDVYVCKLCYEAQPPEKRYGDDFYDISKYINKQYKLQEVKPFPKNSLEAIENIADAYQDTNFIHDRIKSHLKEDMKEALSLYKFKYN